MVRNEAESKVCDSGCMFRPVGLFYFSSISISISLPTHCNIVVLCSSYEFIKWVFLIECFVRFLPYYCRCKLSELLLQESSTIFNNILHKPSLGNKTTYSRRGQAFLPRGEDSKLVKINWWNINRQNKKDYRLFNNRSSNFEILKMEMIISTLLNTCWHGHSLAKLLEGIVRCSPCFVYVHYKILDKQIKKNICFSNKLILKAIATLFTFIATAAVTYGLERLPRKRKLGVRIPAAIHLSCKSR